MKRAKSQLPVIHPRALIRTPQFPLDEEFRDSWEALKMSISYASPGFYDMIKEMDYQNLLTASDAVRYTTWKYFNRSKYRATPFGSFASVGLLDIVTSNDKAIIVESKQQLYHFNDWPEGGAAEPLADDIKSLKFLTNHSHYIFHNSIRYLSCFDNQHQLSEVTSDPVILLLLKRCKIPVSYDVIVSALADSICEASIEELTRDLVAAQLLFTSNRPQVIGACRPQKLNVVSGNIPCPYIIAERKVSQGALHLSQLRHLPELAQILNGILEPTALPNLAAFISRFRQKFEAQWVPIMRALDPEIGLGYGNLEQPHIEDLPFPMEKTNPVPDRLSKLKAHMLNHQKSNHMQESTVIHLEDIGLEFTDEPARLPNTLTVLAEFAGERIHIQSIGGCTTNAVLGRFSLCGDGYLDHCREMKTLEEYANPEVLFFDIGYTAEKGAAQINMRASIYDLQLNLLNYGTSPDQLTLDDLFLSVQGNELVLYSRKLRKRLIPRLASAYNYSRSDLTVFRLLCDLQHQGILADLNINLRDLYPDLSYYPRLMFKNIIISAAAWKIDIKQISCYATPEVSLILANLKKLGVPRLFKTGETDQTLCFDQDSAEDMHAFVSYLNKRRTFYIQEAWNSSFACDAAAHPYQNQLALTLTHQDKIYHGIDPDFPAAGAVKTKTCFLPGSRWLYYQIYCHPSRTQTLLLEVIRPFLNQFRPVIENWFFIRYNENGHHLRLRLCLRDPDFSMRLTSLLSTLLDAYLESGIVSEFLIATYKPEIERYGADLIEQVEVHFCRDSELVLALLATPFNSHQKYKLCENIFQSVSSSGIFEQQEFEYLIRSMCDSFVLEFHVTAKEFKQLNETYHKFSNSPSPLLTPLQKEIFDRHCSSLTEILKSCDAERREKLFSDLIHMHVNRLFVNAQRKQEFAMYYFVSKRLKSARFNVVQ